MRRAVAYSRVVLERLLCRHFGSRYFKAKKQQMRWTERGAHLLLQIRAQVLNQTWHGTLTRWYAGMKAIPEMKAA